MTRRSQLTVKIAESDINNTMPILRAMTDEEIKKKQDAISKVPRAAAAVPLCGWPSHEGRSRTVEMPW